MSILCRCRSDLPVIVPASEHGRLHVGTDVPVEPLWCPAWPEVPLWERRSMALLHPRPKRFRTIRPKGQRVPVPWHYSFVRTVGA